MRSDEKSEIEIEGPNDALPKLEGPGDKSEGEAANREEDTTENVTIGDDIGDDLDGDSTIDMALTLREGLRSLDKRVLRSTKSVLEPETPQDSPPVNAICNKLESSKISIWENVKYRSSRVFHDPDKRLLGETRVVSFEL